MGNNLGQPVAGHPNKTEAIKAFHAQGMPPFMIAEKVGSTPASVSERLRQLRRAAGDDSDKRLNGNKRPGRKTLAERAEANAARDTRGIWTPEKLEKARRLFGKTMILIAEALEVPPKELLEYGLKGVLPPMGEGQRVAQLVASREPGTGASHFASDGQEQTGETAANQESKEPETLALPAPEVEPDRDDDEAELARLAEVEDEDDADDDPPSEPQPEPVNETGPSVAPPAPAAEAPRRYRLTNELGEFLHESGHGMTRNPRLAWSGTPIEIEQMRRKKPQIKQLDEVPYR
jgi:hypothetical protein